MLKQINKQLLEKYPLLWNMRVADFTLLILLVHVLHLILGYVSFSGVERMRWHRPDSMFFSSSFAVFSIIGSFVVFILWLIRYFRNNAFKSFYPYRNSRLFAEFLILFAISLLNITYYYSYTFGYVLHARLSTNYTLARQDRDIYHKIAPFLGDDKQSYALEQRCYPAPFPMEKRYLETQTQDSAGYTSVAGEADYEYTGSDGHIYTREAILRMTGGYQHSYLNFCDYRQYDPVEEANASKGSELLQRGDAREIRAAMTAFLKVCDRYQIKYRIDAEEWFRWVYNPPYYPLRYTLYHLQDYENTNFNDEALLTTSAYNPNGFYLQADRLQTILDNTLKVHRYQVDAGPFCVLIYIALSLALLIYTFRISSRRIWLISLLGICLLSLFVGALSAIMISGSNSGEGVLILYLFLIAAFLAAAMGATHKTVSGVALTWFIWTAPFILPILAAVYMIRERSATDYISGMYRPSSLVHWISGNYTGFLLICIPVYMLLILALTPLCRKWQALPED